MLANRCINNVSNDMLLFVGSLHYYPDPEIRVGTTVASGTLPCVTGAMTTVSDPDALQLCHEDFMPHLIKHKKFGGEEYEDFS